MSRYTKFEKETIINYNQGDNAASVYTYNPTLIKKLDKACALFPCLFILKSEFFGAKTYILPKKYISIRMPPNYERKNRQEEHMKNMRNKIKKPYNKD